MTFLLLLIHTACAFGFAYVAGFSKLTLAFRESLAKVPEDWPSRWTLMLLECPACVGFHLGWSAALAIPAPAGVEPTWLWIPMLGFYTSATNFILGRTTGLIERH